MAIRDHHEWHSTSYVDAWIKDAMPTTRSADRCCTARQPCCHLLPIRNTGARRRRWLRAIQCRSPRHNSHGRGCACRTTRCRCFERARQRLAQFGDRVEYRVCDLRDPDWPAQVGGPFDAVISIPQPIAAHGTDRGWPGPSGRVGMKLARRPGSMAVDWPLEFEDRAVFATSSCDTGKGIATRR